MREAKVIFSWQNGGIRISAPAEGFSAGPGLLCQVKHRLDLGERDMIDRSIRSGDNQAVSQKLAVQDTNQRGILLRASLGDKALQQLVCIGHAAACLPGQFGDIGQIAVVAPAPEVADNGKHLRQGAKHLALPALHLIIRGQTGDFRRKAYQCQVFQGCIRRMVTSLQPSSFSSKAAMAASCAAGSRGNVASACLIIKVSRIGLVGRHRRR